MVAASTAAAVASGQSTTTIRGPKWSRSTSARVRVRLAMRTSGAPSARSASTIGPGAAAGAEHQRGAGGGGPVGRVLAQVGDEAVAVGVVGVDRAVLDEGQGVGGADRRGARAGAGGERQGRLLVRDGDVDAAEAEPGQRQESFGEAFGRERDRDVEAGDAVAVEPVAVQLGRARVRDRPAEDAGERRGRGHSRQIPRVRRKPRSGRSGMPMTVKMSPSTRSKSWAPRASSR